MPLASAAEQYRRQQRVTAAAVRDARAAKGADGVAGVVEKYQITAAQMGANAVPDMLAEQGIPDQAVAIVNPRGFTTDGVAQMVANVATNQALDRLVGTLVQDAGRAASGVGTAIRYNVDANVRHLNPPSCSRCAVLAGRVYRWSQGFLRHPRCDCVMVPTTSSIAPGLVSDPMVAFERGQIRGLSASDAQAIHDGADLSQVVNVQRSSAGLAQGSSTLARAGRLTPDGIYALAGSRAEAVALLRQHGYTLGRPTRLARATEAPTVRLEDVVGRIDGEVEGLVPARLEAAAKTLDDLVARHGVPVNRFGIGNTSKDAGPFAATGDAGRGGTMNVSRKAFGDKWEAWERSTARFSEQATVRTRRTQLDDTLIHEYGHLVDFHTGEKLSVTRIERALARDMGVSRSDYDLLINGQKSLYARTNREEAIAEAFLDVEANGDGATELSKRIYAELMRLLQLAQATQ